jgi:hypothetical protein
VQLFVHAKDEDGLDVRRGDRTFDFIVYWSQLEPSKRTKHVVANYAAAQSAYFAEIPALEEGEYQLQLTKVFGFEL